MDDDALVQGERAQIAQASLEDLAALMRPQFVARYGRWEASAGTSHTPGEWCNILLGALQQEAHTLDELAEMAGFALSALGITLDKGAREALQGEWALPVLKRCAQELTQKALVTPIAANAFFRELRHYFRDRAHIRGKRVMLPIHAALAGSLQGPCLGIVASLLGLEQCQERLRRFS